jgi:hypothetical protein
MSENAENKVTEIGPETAPEAVELKGVADYLVPEVTGEERVQEVDGFVHEDLIALNFYFQQALNQMIGRAHYWITYHAGKMQRYLKAYDSTLQAHPAHGDYKKTKQELITAGFKDAVLEAELRKRFPEYLAYIDEQKAAPADGFKVRRFKADWCLKSGASAALSAALAQFDLVDDPEKLLDLLYKEDPKEDKKGG